MNFRRMVVFCVIAFTAGLVVAHMRFQKETLSVTRNGVMRMFRTLPPTDAYAWLKKTYPEEIKGAHGFAHVAGAMIYERLGARGVSVCDDSYTYGCYHGFYGKALETEGPDFLSNADAICTTKSGALSVSGCFHGVGHGLLAWNGYREEDLRKALFQCDIIGSSLGKRGCYNGAFMEYNSRTFLSADSDSVSPREYTRDGAPEPCADLPEQYHEACFIEQSSWWVIVGVTPHESILLCQTLKTPSDQRACAWGLGRAWVPSQKHSIATISASCKGFSSHALISSCAEAASEMLLYEKGREQAVTFCGAVGGSFSPECRSHVQTIECEVLGSCKE